ncbi:hypothetical protein LA080_012762 [Diaporthe eres]|nr:hypothetical protein LA080_012762 [Diaporthe eres]
MFVVPFPSLCRHSSPANRFVRLSRSNMGDRGSNDGPFHYDVSVTWGPLARSRSTRGPRPAPIEATIRFRPFPPATVLLHWFFTGCLDLLLFTLNNSA